MPCFGFGQIEDFLFILWKISNAAFPAGAFLLVANLLVLYPVQAQTEKAQTNAAIKALKPMTSSAKTSSQADNFAGTWQGTIKIGNGTELPLVFHFQRMGNKYTGTMDSPMQGQNGIAFDTVTVTGDKIHGAIGAHISFDGNLAKDADKMAISGLWSQSGQSLALILVACKEYCPPARPQEPQKPFPYKSQDVSIDSGPNKLSGTLTIPEGQGPFPAVILIHGSGPHDRDETIFSHKPFLLLSDYLTRKGVAVLRYDKRGCGKSGGKYGTATSDDFANDALRAFQFLKTDSQIDAKKIGLVGHSEGGVVAAMVASQNPEIAFVVLLAASAIPGEQLLIEQIRALGQAEGMKAEELKRTVEVARETYAIIDQEKDDKKAITKILAMREHLHAAADKAEGGVNAEQNAHAEAELKVMTGPWYRFFLQYDPGPTLAKVHCPVLALNGAEDKQVLARTNLAAIRDALSKANNKNCSEMILPGLNHLFQTCKTGLPAEYATIDETMSPQVLQIISDWIDSRVKGGQSP